MEGATVPKTVGPRARRAISVSVLILQLSLAPLKCIAADDSDPEDYKFRFNTHWWYAMPSGSLQGNTGPIDFQKDLNFHDYNTFYGLVEWKPRRKHHFDLYLAPNQTSASHVLNRQIEFQGKPFFVGETIHSELKS